MVLFFEVCKANTSYVLNSLVPSSVFSKGGTISFCTMPNYSNISLESKFKSNALIQLNGVNSKTLTIDINFNIIAS